MATKVTLVAVVPLRKTSGVVKSSAHWSKCLWTYAALFYFFITIKYKVFRKLLITFYVALSIYVCTYMYIYIVFFLFFFIIVHCLFHYITQQFSSKYVAFESTLLNLFTQTILPNHFVMVCVNKFNNVDSKF